MTHYLERNKTVMVDKKKKKCCIYAQDGECSRFSCVFVLKKEEIYVLTTGSLAVCRSIFILAETRRSALLEAALPVPRGARFLLLLTVEQLGTVALGSEVCPQLS